MFTFKIAAIVAIISFGAGAASAFILTDWWNNIGFAHQVKEQADKFRQKQTAAEEILREQLAEARKTKIVYRTIREKAHEITTFSPCLDTIQHGLWNEATASANATEADSPDGAVRAAADAIKAKLTGSSAEPH